MIERKLENPERILLKNIIYLGVIQFVNYLLPLITLPILTKSLTVEDFGKVMIMYALALLALIICEFGFNLTGPYFVAKNVNNKDEVSIYISNVFFIKLGLATIFSLGLLFFFIISNYFNFSQIEIILLIFLVFFQSIQYAWVFQGVEKMSEITKANVISKLIYFLSIILLIKIFNSFSMVLFLFVLSQGLLSYIYMKALARNNFKISFSYCSKERIKEIFIYNLSFFISRLAVVGYTALNSMIVGAKEGLKTAAIYGLAEKFYQLAQNIFSPITQAFYPYMIKTQRFKLMFVFLCVGTLLIGIGCIILSFIAEFIILSVFGKEYIDILKILPYFYILITIVFISMNIGYPLLGALGKLNLVNYSVYAGVLIFFTALFFMGYSLSNLLLCLILAESTVLMLRLFFLFQTFKSRNLLNV